MDIQTILNEILTIIDFQEDKRQFIDRFLSQCIQMAVMEAINTLPDSQKNAFREKIRNCSTTEKMRSAIQEYVPETALFKIVAKVTQKQFEDYIDEIIPTLNPSQKSRLVELLRKINSNRS